MKKSIFYSALALVALASCSQDETTELYQGRAIDFRVDEDGSRAAAVTTSSLSSFTVIGFDGTTAYVPSQTATKNGTVFTLAKNYYWPNSGTLNFKAYYPAASTLGGTLSVTSTAATVTGYTGKATAKDQVDFIYGTGSGTKTANETSGATIAFKHMLSQVVFQAKKGASNDLTIKVDSIWVYNVNSKGDCNMATAAWTNQGTPATMSAGLGSGKEITLTTTAQNISAVPMMLIPQTKAAWPVATDKPNAAKGAYARIKVQISQGSKIIFPTSGTGYGSTYVPIALSLEAGKKYTYVLDFNNGVGVTAPGTSGGNPILGQPIKFTCTVTDWTAGTVTNPTL